MTSAAISALLATLALGFVEGLARFYPARQTWRRLRRTRGRFATRRMRERIEEAGGHRGPKVLALIFLVLVIVWVAAASLLDKRWYEVALDAFPYAIAGAALLRTPPAMRRIAERMKEYEREAGEDPDRDLDEDDGDQSDTIAI